MTPTVIFFGGNGHSTSRLDPARAALDANPSPPFVLREVAYPGFEGRPSAPDFEAFLDALSAQVSAICAEAGGGDDGAVWLHGTGIGGLLVLALRGRGAHVEVPAMLQGAVMWGLKERLFPKLMRFKPNRRMLKLALKQSWIQARFARKHFTTPPPPELERAFFQGYNDCAAFSDFFDWLTPALLTRLEEAFAAHPEALERIVVLWGDRDTVVDVPELEQSEAALGVTWPRRVVPGWGHYPMIDDPKSWVDVVADVMRTHPDDDEEGAR